MRLVIDAAVIVAFLLGEGTGEEREAMLGEVHAPSLLDIEATQTLHGLLRAGMALVTFDTALATVAGRQRRRVAPAERGRYSAPRRTSQRWRSALTAPMAS
jgi:hypothetical protein